MIEQLEEETRRGVLKEWEQNELDDGLEGVAQFFEIAMGDIRVLLGNLGWSRSWLILYVPLKTNQICRNLPGPIIL